MYKSSLACLPHLAILVLLLPAQAPAQTVTLKGRVAVHSPDGKRKADDPKSVIWLTPLSGENGEPIAEALLKVRPRLLQMNKTFEPHILVVPVGAQVEFPNRDPVFHNVFSLFDGKRFDLGLYEAGQTRLVHFDRAGISYIFCNIHAQMSAVVVALDTPYYTISNAAGEFSIALPAHNRYTLHVWNEHATSEALQEASRAVYVQQSSLPFVTIQLVGEGRATLAHKNKYGRDYDEPAPTGPLYSQP